ncbi:PLP-dependent transferase [Antarctobacter sp.]|uniref:PLP-dependent transferase n=1 Tax=Antarctobacter sp. TaxID=1872577 RepID=UPI003A8CBAF0
MRNRTDPATGARQVPIYQTTAYVFKDADHAARLFNPKRSATSTAADQPDSGRLANRMAALEGGAGAVCSPAMPRRSWPVPLMAPGKNIVASTRLYGGTLTQFTQTFKRFGRSAKLLISTISTLFATR